MWGSKLLGNYAAGRAGRAIADSGAASYKAGQFMRGAGVGGRGTIQGGLGGMMAGGAMGGAYGAVSDDTSIIGGAMTGAMGGAGMGAVAGRYGAPALYKANKFKGQGLSATEHAAGAARAGYRGAGSQMLADIGTAKSLGGKAVASGKAHADTLRVLGEDSASTIGNTARKVTGGARDVAAKGKEKAAKLYNQAKESASNFGAGLKSNQAVVPAPLTNRSGGQVSTTTAAESAAIRAAGARIGRRAASRPAGTGMVESSTLMDRLFRPIG